MITATAFYSINDVMEKTIAEMDLMSETAVRFTSFLGYGDLMAENCEFFLPHSHLTPSLGVNPSNFWMNFLSRKLESLGLGLSVGEDFVILACVVFTQCQRVTDRRTDRHPDRS